MIRVISGVWIRLKCAERDAGDVVVVVVLVGAVLVVRVRAVLHVGIHVLVLLLL